MASCTGPYQDDEPLTRFGYDWDVAAQRLVLSAGTV